MKRWLTVSAVLADLLGLAALAFVVGLLVVTVGPRLSFPFDLEWMEGGMLLHARRVVEGLPIYTLPDPEYIPYIYPPFYPWLVGMLARFLGLGYTLGRSVTLGGVLVAALLLVWGLRREGIRLGLALGGAALFLSCYDEAGAFFDLVRNDGLLIALLAGSLVACRGGSRGGLVLGGLLLALAFATKHNAALMGLPIAWATWRDRGWRRAGLFVLASALPALLFVGWMQARSGGLFLTYILEVPSTHPFASDRLFPKSEKELLLAFPWVGVPAILVAILLLVEHRLRRRGWLPGKGEPGAALLGPGGRYWLANFVMGIVMCVIMRGHHGGFVNVLIPGWWLVAFVGMMGLNLIPRRFAGAPLSLLCAALVLLQVWQGRWDPSRYIPTPGDYTAGQKVLERIASYEGEVLMPYSPYYPVMVGKKPSFALIALWDITHAGSPLEKQARCVRRAVLEQRYDAIILSSTKFPHGLEKAYKPARAISLPGKDLVTKTGWRARPHYVYEPIPRDERSEISPEGPSDEAEIASEDALDQATD